VRRFAEAAGGKVQLAARVVIDSTPATKLGDPETRLTVGAPSAARVGATTSTIVTDAGLSKAAADSALIKAEHEHVISAAFQGRDDLELTRDQIQSATGWGRDKTAKIVKRMLDDNGTRWLVVLQNSPTDPNTRYKLTVADPDRMIKPAV
jgi:hypothetical protein